MSFLTECDALPAIVSCFQGEADKRDDQPGVVVAEMQRFNTPGATCVTLADTAKKCISEPLCMTEDLIDMNSIFSQTDCEESERVAHALNVKLNGLLTSIYSAVTGIVPSINDDLDKLRDEVLLESGPGTALPIAPFGLDGFSTELLHL